METGLLGGLVFFLVLGGMIFVHELGHFLAARLFKIDVEEFGIGFPPRLMRLWRARGWLLIGQTRLEIPANTDLPFESTEAQGRLVEAQATRHGDRLILRAIRLASPETAQAETVATLSENPDGTVWVRGTLQEIHEGTLFTLNWLFLGGFVRPKGEDDPSIPGSFAAAKAWQRLIVLLAGVMMNLLTALLAYSILFSEIGVPQFSRVVIVGLEAGSPAEQAGVQVGDVVLSAAGKKITSVSQLIRLIRQNLGQPVELVLERNGQTRTVTVVPRLTWPERSGPTGVVLGIPYERPASWFATLPAAARAMSIDINNLLSLPGRLLTGTASPREAQLAGPRSIWNLFQAAVASDVQSRQDGDAQTPPTYYTLAAIIGLSLSLAIFNLLPIPALDGGRVFFLLPELLFRRPIPARYQAVANSIGFLFLLSLLLFFYVKDFLSPISIQLP